MPRSTRLSMLEYSMQTRHCQNKTDTFIVHVSPIKITRIIHTTLKRSQASVLLQLMPFCIQYSHQYSLPALHNCFPCHSVTNQYGHYIHLMDNQSNDERYRLQLCAKQLTKALSLVPDYTCDLQIEYVYYSTGYY